MSMFPAQGAEDFAKWIVENKPYLVEIENEIQKVGSFGEMDIKVSVRRGKVDKLAFYGGRTWMRFDATESK